MKKSIFEDEESPIQLTPQEQQIEQNIQSIFSSNAQSKDNYIQNLKNLYTTFDQLSKEITNSKSVQDLGLSKDEQNAINSLSDIKTNLFTELSKFEKITEQDLKEKNLDKDNARANPNQNSIKNLQLYLDEVKFITSNLTEALNYAEKINHLKQIQGVFKEMTEPRNGLEFKKILTENLKNIVPLTEDKKNSDKKNHDINHELDRMLSQILKEQENLLSLLVSKNILKTEEDTENKKGINETSKLFNDPKDEINKKIAGQPDRKKLIEAKKRYLELHQQECKLRAIQASPDQYLANKATKEQLDKSIQTLRKEIISLRQSSSNIEKEYNELDKKKLATGIFERIFNRIVYGSDKAIDQKVTKLEAKKEQIDTKAADLTRQYQVQNKKRTNNSQLYNAIRTGSPDKLKSIIPDIDPMELYNKVTQQRETQEAQAPEKESWVKRIFRGSKDRNHGVSWTK